MLAAALLLPAGSAEGEKVRELYESGALKAEYFVDTQGRKSGLYKEFHESGPLKVKVIYQADAMEGAYESWHENGKSFITCRYRAGLIQGPWKELRADGSKALTCAYKEGKLEGDWIAFDGSGRPVEEAVYKSGRRHGIRRLFQAGELLSEQEWQADLLVGLFGSRLLYRMPLAEMQASLAELQNDPDLARLVLEAKESGDPARHFAAQRALGLARLRGHRYLAGLTWQDFGPSPEAEERALEAARLLEAHGAIEYAPLNPGWEEERYTRARDALQRCNLAQGLNLEKAVDAWMLPTDLGSFPKMFARRLCLEPRMLRIGLGQAGKFSTLWTGDSSGPVWSDSGIFYPARGWMPVEWYDPASPWTARLNPTEFQMPDERLVQVRVRALDENHVLHGEAFPIERLRADRDQLIFHPQLVVKPGFLYWVEVDGLKKPDGTPARLAWLVHFVSARAEAEAAPG
jgi:antitoxin component YwqK of YwqJK toxin-antitoxin module